VLSIAFSRAAAWAATLVSPDLLPIVLLVGSNPIHDARLVAAPAFKQVPLAAVTVAS